MKLLNSLEDLKINAMNHLLEMSIEEYAKVAQEIINNNELQRRRVRTSKSVYALLKDDLKTGCVIPPIVLATFPEGSGKNPISSATIVDTIRSSPSQFIVLDGLQRSYTILDLLSEIETDEEMQKRVRSLPLRIEVYTGISKIGVLYRMLTLNTGQTPMSTRHQIEIIYSDYKQGIEDLRFISEVDNRAPSGDKEYRFRDVLDGFLSYITSDFLPIDREDLISIVKNLEALTKDDKQMDQFKIFAKGYDNFRSTVARHANNWQFRDSGDQTDKRPFGKNVNEIFSKVQVIAGFGAGLSFLVEKGLLVSIGELDALINQISPNEAEDALNAMIGHLDEIQMHAKKIGNEQRMYFYYFVRNLFNRDSDGFLNLGKATSEAYRYYKSNAF
jgi:hypothetical protein